MRRLAPLSLVLCVGCSDLLGLDGLTYDQVESTPGSGGGGAGGTGGTGSTIKVDGTGGAEPPPSRPDLFPARWERGLLLAALHPGPPLGEDTSLYWTYEPVTGSLSSYHASWTVDGALGEVSTSPGWDTLLALPGIEGPELLGYDITTGLTETGPAPGDRFASEPTAGSPAWTHLVAFAAGGASPSSAEDEPAAPESTWLFAYDAASGNFRLGPWTPEGPITTPLTGTWEPGWQQIAPAEIGGDLGLLRFNGETASAEFLPLEDSAFGAPLPLMLPSEPTSHVFPIRAGWLDTLAQTPTVSPPERSSRLLTYDAAVGTVVLHHVEDDGTLVEMDRQVWRSGLTAIVPLRLAGVSVALLYSSETGIATMLDLSPLGIESPTIIR